MSRFLSTNQTPLLPTIPEGEGEVTEVGLGLVRGEIGGCKGDYSTGAVIIERCRCQIAGRRKTKRTPPRVLSSSHTE